MCRRPTLGPVDARTLSSWAPRRHARRARNRRDLSLPRPPQRERRLHLPGRVRRPSWRRRRTSRRSIRSATRVRATRPRATRHPVRRAWTSPTRRPRCVASGSPRRAPPGGRSSGRSSRRRDGRRRRSRPRSRRWAPVSRGRVTSPRSAASARARRHQHLDLRHVRDALHRRAVRVNASALRRVVETNTAGFHGQPVTPAQFEYHFWQVSDDIVWFKDATSYWNKLRQ
jgi:hypothetical protein